jgi:hypothetical protein
MRIVAARKHCLRAPDKNAATAGGPMDQGCAALFNPENSSVFLNLLLVVQSFASGAGSSRQKGGLRLNGNAATAGLSEQESRMSWRTVVEDLRAMRAALFGIGLASRNPGHCGCLTAKGYGIWVRRKKHGSEKRRKRKGGRSRAGMCVENVFPARVERVAAMTQSN